MTLSPITVQIRISEINQYQFTRCDYINSIRNTVGRLIRGGSTVDSWNNDIMISKSNTEIPLYILHGFIKMDTYLIISLKN